MTTHRVDWPNPDEAVHDPKPRSIAVERSTEPRRTAAALARATISPTHVLSCTARGRRALPLSVANVGLRPSAGGSARGKNRGRPTNELAVSLLARLTT
jgi:hypothetical protein